ncbi:MAG: hypothetical protein ACI845_000864 [Gammaproteobacteria bacterium]|jgi:hypothetical protein
MHRFFIISCSIAAAALSSCSSVHVSPEIGLISDEQVFLDVSIRDIRNGGKAIFQNGEIIQKKQLDTWQGYCELYFYNSNETVDYKTLIDPGYFEISRVNTEFESVAVDLSLIFLASLDQPDIDLPSYVLYQTQLWLKSADQPDVQSLSCFQKSSIKGDHMPNRHQITRIMGQLLRF